MDARKINTFLHSDYIPHHYKAKTGDTLHIRLPKVPFTRFTEFLQLEQKRIGDTDCFLEEVAYGNGEGNLLPSQIFGRAVCPGTLHIVLSAKDVLSGHEVPGVKPLDITIEIE